VDLTRYDHEARIKQVFDKCTGKSTHTLIVILPKKDTSEGAIVKKIKSYGDVEFGVHTICMTLANLQKANVGTFANIALKVNAKLGGTNHYLSQNHCRLIREDKTMFVGIDVTHPGPGSAPGAPSVSAMVASTSLDLGFSGSVRLQTRARTEMVSGIKDLLDERLTAWGRAHNGKLPENIIVYRDGVSEGQYQQVVDDELAPMKAACKKRYSADLQKRGLPRFLVAIAGKRHHTRFYPTKEADSQGHPMNTKPGTVVDRGVTEAHNWEFFLQPHAALQGTARPTHYFVLRDEVLSSPEVNKEQLSRADMLETLTHELCYLYCRATKAVSLCPPVYHAHLLCDRARYYLHDVFDASAGPTPSGTQASNTPTFAAMESRVRAHPRLAQSMYWI
jgi:eukaryotic translation initiation factor 2C